MVSAILSVFVIVTSLLPHPLSGPREAKLNQEFKIRFGESVSIGNKGLKISFSDVAEDSRCPQGVQCIWAGNGKVILKVRKSRKPSAEMSLNTTFDTKQDVYQGYEVKLVSLNPYPKKDHNIKKEEYVATLVVSRR